MQERHRGTRRIYMATKLLSDSAEWYRDEAKRKGVSVSHYIADVLENHRHHRDPHWRKDL